MTQFANYDESSCSLLQHVICFASFRWAVVMLLPWHFFKPYFFTFKAQHQSLQTLLPFAKHGVDHKSCNTAWICQRARKREKERQRKITYLWVSLPKFLFECGLGNSDFWKSKFLSLQVAWLIALFIWTWLFDVGFKVSMEITIIIWVIYSGRDHNISP